MLNKIQKAIVNARFQHRLNYEQTKKIITEEFEISDIDFEVQAEGVF